MHGLASSPITVLSSFCIDEALSVLPGDALEHHRLFAYRVSPRLHRGGTRLDFSLPPDVRPETIPSSFLVRGYNAVSRSTDHGGLSCSPLSCNYLAPELNVNEFCLFPTLDAL